MPTIEPRNRALWTRLLRKLGLPQHRVFTDAVQTIVTYGIDGDPPDTARVNTALSAMENRITNDVHAVHEYRRVNRIRGGIALNFPGPIQQDIMAVIRDETRPIPDPIANEDGSPLVPPKRRKQESPSTSYEDLRAILLRDYKTEAEAFAVGNKRERGRIAAQVHAKLVREGAITPQTLRQKVSGSLDAIAHSMPNMETPRNDIMRVLRAKYADYIAKFNDEDYDDRQTTVSNVHYQMTSSGQITRYTEIGSVYDALVALVLPAEDVEVIADVPPEDVIKKFYKREIEKFAQADEKGKAVLAEAVHTDMVNKGRIEEAFDVGQIAGILATFAAQYQLFDDPIADHQATRGIAQLTSLLNRVYSKDKVTKIAIRLGKEPKAKRASYVKNLGKDLEKAGYPGINPVALLEVLDLVRDEEQHRSFAALDDNETALRSIASIRQMSALLNRDYFDITADFVNAAHDRRGQLAIAARLTKAIQKRTDLDFEVSDLAVIEALDGIANAKQRNLRGGGSDDIPPPDADDSRGPDTGSGGDAKGGGKGLQKKATALMRKEVEAIAGLLNSDQAKPASARALTLSKTLKKALGDEAPSAKNIIALAQRQVTPVAAAGDTVKLSMGLIKKAKWDDFGKVYGVDKDSLAPFKDIALFVVKGGVEAPQAISTARTVIAAQKKDKSVKSQFRNAVHVVEAVEDLLRRKAMGNKLMKDVKKEKA